MTVACRYLVMIACGLTVTAGASNDHVLRFLNHAGQQPKQQGGTYSVFKMTPNICPDGKSVCPQGQTCCQDTIGEYGCCPIPNATCCADHKHCCPHGYTCDTQHMRCNKGLESVPLMQKMEALVRVTANVCPDGKSECPQGQTCCPLASGGYGCCPTPNATCCADHVHCCPQGYTCDTQQGTCKKGLESVPLVQKLEALVRVTANTCPDGKSKCLRGQTCCPLASGGYGCCPIPNATCCADHKHCCPHGYTCDTQQGACKKGLESVPLRRKLEALVRVTGNTCPDGKSECPQGQTCCPLASGGYGCCPTPNATCCADHIHCCPHAYTCDTQQGTCKMGLESVPLRRKLEALVRVTANICPDGKSECPQGQTCCPLTSGGYGCCPTPNATCCADHVHCCPHGYTCDTQQGTCKKGLESVPLRRKLEALVRVTANTCPDGKSECPQGQTCCPLASGGYGCCPTPNAACCADHVHCCPQGYTCDTQQGTCKKGLESVPLMRKMEALVSVTANVCPDGKSECPQGQTCCPLTSGGYGCCPTPNATCCADHVHCCPHGYTCDTQQGTCKKGLESVPLRRKMEALVRVTANICPDGKSECPQGQTCCPLTSGGYGCCPTPNATCCADHVHCCPHGYTCDTQQGTCKKGLESIPLMRKIEALVRVTANTCPDRKSECPDGQTCCPFASGGYGCCPSVDATCCPDFVHCCPHGFRCDLEEQRCIKGLDSASVMKKFKAIVRSTVAFHRNP